MRLRLKNKEIEKARQEIADETGRSLSSISDDEAEFYLMSEDLGAVLMALQIYLKEE